MPVHVKLSTTLRDCVAGYVPEQGLNIDMAHCVTLADLALLVGLELDQIKIVMVNGRQKDLGDAVNDGERVAFFPAVGGG